MDPLYIGLIAFGAVLITGIAIYFYFVKQRNKMLEELKKIGTLDGKQITIMNQKFYYILVKVSGNEDFTINSKSVIQVKSKSNSKLISVPQDDIRKLIIVYPYKGKLKRYINENEMEFITFKDSFWNMNVVKIDELENFKKYLEDKYETQDNKKTE